MLIKRVGVYYAGRHILWLFHHLCVWQNRKFTLWQCRYHHHQQNRNHPQSQTEILPETHFDEVLNHFGTYTQLDCFKLYIRLKSSLVNIKFEEKFGF